MTVPAEITLVSTSGLPRAGLTSPVPTTESDNWTTSVCRISFITRFFNPKSAQSQSRNSVFLFLLAAFGVCFPAASLPGLEAENVRKPDQWGLPPIVFTVRHQYKRDHHNTATFFPSAKHEHNDGRFTAGGALKLRRPDGVVETLLETKTGVIRDPDVSWDAQKILFSMRKDVRDSYHVYEMDVKDKSVKQLTFAKDVDDLFPFYLADGHIGFSSTREPKYCGCNRHIMANLHRMEPDGANIFQISKNTLFDSRGRMLPDGRILYDRWEYVDRNFGDSQALWTCNPDGTNHVVYYGNNTPSPGAVIDARPIPGSDLITCLFAACHDRPWGALAILDRKLGIDGEKPVWRIWDGHLRKLIGDVNYPSFNPDLLGNSMRRKIASPYALSAEKILYTQMIRPNSEKTGLYLGIVDKSGNLLYEDREYGCYEPVPLMPRKRPPVIPFRRDFDGKTGTFYVQDVYQGTHLKGIKRGDVKFLRVIESPEKRFWSKGALLSTVAPAVNWDELMNKRVLGVVPVNADGSATFEVPAEKFLFFQLLDKDGVMLQSMRSGTYVQPGEVNACVGCHEDRLSAPRTKSGIVSAHPKQTAALTAPAKAYSYFDSVQPVWDKYCAGCHSDEKPEGKKLNLTGGTGVVFNRSYCELWAKHWIKVVGSGPARHLEAKSWGALASRIYPFITTNHEGINLKEKDPAAFRKVVEWIDINAPYYPDYATSYYDNPYGRCPLTTAEIRQLEKLTGQKIFVPSHVRYYDVPTYVDEKEQLNPRDAIFLKAFTSINFDEPEKSPVLRGVASASVREQALRVIQTGKERIKQNGRNESEGFRYCEIDAWREAKYQQSRKRESEFRKAIAEGRKIYDK